ncbi:Rtr1/RPAP2 family-domain-containing protein [Microdochium trichocladiopsis]|uniref:RNA polymerase II subunit B1 CTD phosphatase RPAP2 homolog n=1 Tax=Microdochium trichocladiopsis TaxID=1682393 RepID=A0A9P9BUC0_9PEZI|nr:Rtr1/RPAP2 family-domain-containing protein [Microdochium trichocladiopsis]KAH7031309.1 Rtr1/RPAP2 family-domain-containing protein [Microdochium trichocladiopsis]
MASQPPAKPKGILKKPGSTAAPVKASGTSTSQDASKPAISPEEARRIAIHHATLIHQRRDLEDIISDSIIDLSKLPLYHKNTSQPGQPPHTAADPHPADASTFTSQVRLFQPTDYDDLIEERNILGKCGYVLCPKPKTKVSQAGDWKIVGYGTKDFNIVPKAEIEKWCSTKCARRAMYVKVQLNESAAWERAGIPSIQIELLEEEETAQQKAQREAAEDPAAKVARELAAVKLDADQRAKKQAQDLALERGDTDEAKAARRDIEVTIREKRVMMEAKEPSLAEGAGHDEAHMILDGYKPKFDPRSETVPEPVTAEEAAEVKDILAKAEQTDAAGTQVTEASATDPKAA